jgi:cobyrinic acid a,c-diamide synthase
MTTPGLLIAGTHSGCGKSTVMSGLIAAFIKHGYVIAPFKVGPDYLDPILHKAVACRSSWNLDSWFLSDTALMEAWNKGTFGADLALVEGAMGLFDGADPISFYGSGADIATRLNLPIILVVNAAGVGSTVAATVLGCTKLMPSLNIVGVIFNCVASERHYRLLETTISTHTDVVPLGWINRSQTWCLPERYLGIFNPEELPKLQTNLDTLSSQIESNIDLKIIASMAQAPTIIINTPKTTPSNNLPVAIASDEAFSFVYADTLERLERMGVHWIPFSPLRDKLPNNVAGVYLPGGYPELHAKELTRNRELFVDLRAAYNTGMPIFAECGGYMLLSEAIIDINGYTYSMANLIPGYSRMTNKLQSFGYKNITATQNTLLCHKGETGRAHEFHYSLWEGDLCRPAWQAKGIKGDETLQGYAEGNLLASYIHLHFGAMPHWAKNWVKKMQTWFTKGTQ